MEYYGVLHLILQFKSLVAGLNGYFVIFDLEPFIETSPAAMSLFEFQYLLIFEKSLEILCGILLIINRFIPLALAVLSPIVANIFLLHLFVDHSLLLLAIIIVILHFYLLYCFRKNFIGILEKKPSP
mgnify:CR=1 FL=1